MGQRSIYNPRLCILTLLPLLSCLFASPGEAADFTVVSITNSPDVAVYEVIGNYDAELSDGASNLLPRQEISRKFYAVNPDAYDFLVIFSNFDFRMPQGEAVAYYHEVKNDVQGIGKELIDNTTLYGSDGTLQGIIDMGNIGSLAVDPFDSDFSDTMGILSHELLHRWAAEVAFRNDDGFISTGLLGKEGCHWSFLLDTAGSLEYGNHWMDNGNGTFTSLAGRRYFSPLDLYLMGLIDRSEVPPMLLIDNPEIDPERLPEPGITISGTPQYITIDNIIAAEGERIPSAADSPKTFRVGAIYITRPGTFFEDDLHAIRTIMKSWAVWFSGLTGGKGKIVVDSPPSAALPVNPGPLVPIVDPRSTPPELNDGVAWLLNNQQQDGSWQDSPLTTIRDTATVLHALTDYPEAAESYGKGIAWLQAGETANLDYLARKIELLDNSGIDVMELVADLLARQNPDGGWGNNRKYESSPADTALAVQAITAAGSAPSTVTGPAVAYLLGEQNDDSGWGAGGRSSVQTTIEVITALLSLREQHQLDRPIASALSWVYGRQNPDGGFGDGSSTIYATARTLLTLKRMGIASPAADRSLTYLLDRQGGDGSWLASACQTALAVEAVWRATREPDLSVSTEQIIPFPDPVELLPADLRLEVAVSNTGMTDVTEAEVALYEDSMSDAGLIGRETVSVSGRSSETVVFDTLITDGRPHHYFVAVDPDNLVRESSEQNNSALRIVYPESTYDFAVSAEGFSISPAVGSIFEPLSISAAVRNNGTTDAISVPLQLAFDRGTGPVIVASRTMDLPAGQTAAATFSWIPEISGSGIPLAVTIDPHNAFAEMAEDNNEATISFDINGSTKPDLALSFSDISFDPEPAREGGTAILRAIVRNRGFSPATEVQVDFYEGKAGEDSNGLLGTVAIPEVAPHESAEAVLEWTDIPVSGERAISVVLDPRETIDEIREDNNGTFATLMVLSLPDLSVAGSEISFIPGAPQEGEKVTVSAVVRNGGGQSAVNIPVMFRQEGEVIGMATIGEIAANGRQPASATFTAPAKAGITAIEVIVDPEGTIREQDRNNNTAEREVGIQNADLWLSNSYISPNGDGVKDAARFGCRLEKPQNVTVAVVNKEGEVVREFSGPDFIGAVYVSLTWDGLDSRGRVVADGSYRMQVRSEAGTVLASLLVTVDTNRSSLLEAIGTPYLYEGEIRDFLADNRWIWLLDESGILFHLEKPNENIPDYPTGLYTMSPTGGDITRLVPWDWNSNFSEDTGYRFRSNSSDCSTRRWSEFFPGDQVNPGFSLANDGLTVAFILERYSKASGQVEESQLWTASRFGTNLTLLASFDQTGEQQRIITDIFWSPDGSLIAYKSHDQVAGRHDITIIAPDGSEKTAIVPQWAVEKGNEYALYWSPDSRRIAFAETARIVVADLDGRVEEVLSVGDQGTFINWLGNSRLLLRDLGDGSRMQTVWVVDLSDGAEPRLIGEDLEIPVGVYDSQQCIRAEGEEFNAPVTGSGHFLAAVDSSHHPYNAYTICNGDGVCHAAPILDFWWSNFTLTPGGGNMVHSFYDGLLEVHHLETGETDVRVIGDYACSIDWERDYPDLPSAFNILPVDGECDPRAFMEVVRWNWLDETIFLACYYGRPDGVIAYDFATGEKTYLPSHWRLDQLLLSPGGRYISYASDYNRTAGRYGTVNINGSLLNLTADLRPVKTDSEVILQGTAADLNFAGWMLEYADRQTPDDWHSITPSVEKAVVNDVLAAWIPPYEGSFLVRLTVTDMAGNTAWDRRLVTWGGKFSVTDIRKTGEIFSPNGDGVKDTVGLQYRVHEPVHLEFFVHDQAGSPIRAFSRDHALPGQYEVVWDGRDESGGIVPDGYYAIRIFDYEFFVQVDTTPPNALLHFSPVSCVSSPAPSAVLSALALDRNLKSWTVVYGEGHAPTDWYEYKSGTTPLVRTTGSGEAVVDDAGTPLPEPIETFTPETSPAFGFLGRTTYRLVVEDLAGNQSAAADRLVEEMAVLNGWDDTRITLEKGGQGGCASPDGDLLSIDLLQPGIHRLKLVETIGAAIASATVQYRRHMQWHDAERIVDPPDGTIELAFDTSSLVPEEIAAVREKIVDAAGMEYFSNSILFRPPVFTAEMGCIPEGSLAPAVITMQVSLAESLKTIHFQATRTAAGAVSWQDIAEYDVFDGFPYQFAAPPADGLPEGSGYPLRFVGIGESGRVYISNELFAPPQQCTEPEGDSPSGPGFKCETTFDVTYEGGRASCNSVHVGAATMALRYCPNDEPKVRPDAVRYYLEDGTEWRLLKQFSPAGEGWGSVSIDTGGLAEGRHRVRVDLVYGDSVVEGFRTNTLFVDRTLPDAQITFPSASDPFCARTAANAQGDVLRYADIEGVAADENGIAGYSVIYGEGDNPDPWFAIVGDKPCRPEEDDCPYIAAEEKIGLLGSWNITAVDPAVHSLQLMVTDRFGNTSCFAAQVREDQDMLALTAAVGSAFLSPNDDGKMDRVALNYHVGEDAVLDITVLHEGAVVRTLVSGLEIAAGSGAVFWDGLDNAGETVPDGGYRLQVVARDRCGHRQEKTLFVTVDTTPPTTMIFSPGNGEALEMVTEIRGTVTDAHLISYQLQAENEGGTEDPISIREGDMYVENGILGIWNTFGLEGQWSLILTGNDLAGNTGSTRAPVSLGARPGLIGSLKAAPRVFSPNDDGIRDATAVACELTDAVNVTIAVEDMAGKQIVGVVKPDVPAGTYHFRWDGRDAEGNPVPDGNYRLRVTAESLAAPFVVQAEKMTLVTDTAPPAIEITSPADLSFHAGVVTVRGALSDANLQEYSAVLSGGRERFHLSASMINNEMVFSNIVDLPEGIHVLRIEAADSAGNFSSREVSFSVDATRPHITLDTPDEGQFFGGSQAVVAVRGMIEEANPHSYSVQYGQGAEPGQWVELASGTEQPQGNVLAEWDVGSDQQIADGDYTIRVWAVDEAGWESTARRSMHVDNHPPELAVILPENKGFVREPLDIIGTVSDVFLREYDLGIASSACSEAVNWSILGGGVQPVENGRIASLRLLPVDGPYCIRLSATDFLDNTADQRVDFIIDTTPPTAPVLSGSLVRGSGVSLAWETAGGADVIGFNLYRNGRRVNSAPIDGFEFLDQDPSEGEYVYTVRALDQAGWESVDSNEAVFTVDLTPPAVMIDFPREGSRVGNYVAIKGRAYSEDDFKEYRVLCGFGENPQSWQMLRTSPAPVSYGVLVRWDAIHLDDGPYTIRLEAEDLHGNISVSSVGVTVDNAPPAAPILVAATADGSTVALSWQANTEPDLAGYLVFRDNQPANATGMVIGDLSPYLLAGLGYEDVGVPDGNHEYYLVAVDSAGNMSKQSNVMEVSINTRPPHLRIVSPPPGLQFDKTIPVRAEAEDTDIAAVRFQYQRNGGTGWTDFGPALVGMPYAVNLDPWLLDWDFGVYRLRAVASDQAGLTDEAPQEIEIEFTDVTPPVAPAGVTARVEGGFITLAWNKSPATDLAGYNVYMGMIPQRRNPEPLTGTTYVDPAGGGAGLDNGTYQYWITAVDAAGNESEKGSATATVFSPVLEPLPAVVNTPDITVAGHTVPEAAVEIVRAPDSGALSLGTVQADAEGLFSLTVSLEEGENMFAAVATDPAGNISRPSNARTVRCDLPPAAPTGLAAAVSDDDVLLSWDAGREFDLLGYNLYRNGEKINPAASVVSGTFSASAYSSLASLAMDGNPETYWNSSWYTGAFGPAWWDVYFEEQSFLTTIEIEWGGNELGRLTAGKDYVVQVLAGGAWQQVATATDNSARINTFDLEQPVKAEGLRIYVTASTDGYTYKTVQIAEVRITRVTFISGEAYADLDLADGEYEYRLSAVDAFGSESPLSPEAGVVVGDVIPPAPPRNLIASAEGADCLLSWQANSESDLAGYNIYRASTDGWLRLNTAPVTAVSHTDAGLKNGTYTYRVTAVDGKGNESNPSNDSTATIEQQPPAPPSNLVAGAAAEGRTINLCWNASDDPVAGYHIYRSMISGGPYMRVNGSLVREHCFCDTGLTDGTEYFYTARAVDAFGNESIDSNEDSATPRDNRAPGRPLLLLPTVSGRPHHSATPRVDIGGVAEAGAAVVLVHDQQWAGRSVQTQREAAQESHFLTAYRAFETVVTPDGRSVYYVLTENTSSPYSYYTFRKDLLTGVATRVDPIPEGTWNHMVSPDGTKIAYCYDNGPSNIKIGIYDRTTGLAAPLTSATDVVEYDPAWSMDGSKIVFEGDRGDGVDDIWIHDLVGKQTSRVTDHFEGFYPKISADAQKVAFHVWNRDTKQLHLYLVDAVGGSPYLLAEDVDWSNYYPSAAWSPVTDRIAYSAEHDGVYDIYVYDIGSGETVRLTETEDTEIYPQWSPDGSHIAYYIFTGEETEVRMVSAAGGAEDRLLHSFAGSVASDFNWLPAGIFYRTGADLHRIITPGTFLFRDVALQAGRNNFTATAEDKAGNVSQPADEIVIAIDTAAMPDLEVRAEDIFMLPEALLDGEEALFSIVVGNRSPVAAENVPVEVYVWDAGDTIELIHSETIPSLGPFAAEWLSARWDSTGMTGANSIIVLLDPHNEIVEGREENNAASREFQVAGEAGVTFETSVNGTEFAADEIVSIVVAMQNSGGETDVRLAVAIEDEQGVQVEELAVFDTTLPYGGSDKVALKWEAGSVLAGTYRVRAVLRDGTGGFIGEQVRPFTILPDVDVSVSLAASKARFGPDEDVLLDCSVTNRSANAMLPELRIRLTIADQAVVRHVEEQALVNMYPLDSARLDMIWNTQHTPPGRYAASVEVFLDGEPVAAAATELVIVPVLSLNGSLSVEPGVVQSDGRVHVGFTVTGGGNVELGAVLLRLRVLETKSWTTVSVHEETLTLGVGEVISGGHEFYGRPWETGIHQVLLEAVRLGETEMLDVDTFTARDGVPPVISVLSPGDGSTLSEGIELSVAATDEASGVAKAEYQVDDGAWLPLMPVHSATGRYAAVWLPEEADEGPHTVRFRAADYAGNVCLPAETAIIISPRVAMTAAADKLSYGMQEDLGVIIDLVNSAWRKHVHLTVTVETREGARIALLADEDLVLEADARQNLHYTWRTGTVDAGTYIIRATLEKNGGILAERHVTFTVEEVLALDGSLHLSALSVPFGDPVTVEWSLANNGNFNLTDLAVEAILIESAGNWSPIMTEALALWKGQAVSGSLTLPTEEMALGSCQVVLKARYGSEDVVLADVGFELIDGTPPLLSIISPAEGMLVDGPIELRIAAVDDAAGVELVEYRIDQGEWRQLAAENPEANTYAVRWTPGEADEGNRTISFRGRDRAGNISESAGVSVVIELCSAFEDLEGTLRVSPMPLYYSQDVVFDYVVVNRCAKTLDSLTLRVAVQDPVTDAVVHEAITTAYVAPSSSTAGSLALSTLELSVQPYTVALEVSQPGREFSKLAEASFKVLPAVETGNRPLERTNLLVWFNCGSADCAEETGGSGRPGKDGENYDPPPHQKNCAEECRMPAFLEDALHQAADYTVITRSRGEFEHELRNPLYTDILIIGGRQSLTDHHAVELREKVYSGTGLISFGWNEHGDYQDDEEVSGHHNYDEAYLGVNVRGVITLAGAEIILAASPVTSAGVLSMAGRIASVEPVDSADVVGWVADGCLHDAGSGWIAKKKTGKCDYPAIVLHEYGLGRTVYAAFDLCGSDNAINAEQLAGLLRNAVAYVHRPETDPELIPYQVRSYAVAAASPGLDLDLRMSIACPPDIMIFDPVQDDWILDYPWIVTFPLPAGTSAVVPYDLLVPDREGVFTCELQAVHVAGGQETRLHDMTYAVNVPKDRNRLIQEAMTAIGGLPASGRERAQRDNALRFLRKMDERPGMSREDAEKNIHDIEKAVDALLRIDQVATGEVRLQLDTLLRIEQGKWYFYE